MKRIQLLIEFDVPALYDDEDTKYWASLVSDGLKVAFKPEGLIHHAKVMPNKPYFLTLPEEIQEMLITQTSENVRDRANTDQSELWGLTEEVLCSYNFEDIQGLIDDIMQVRADAKEEGGNSNGDA